ncbi:MULTISPECIES: PKD domain-containing protein [Pontibacter]|uniref:PKD domain-containing protein n=1 Tax=Pontibacter TaxID=323449 RepID=UPI00293F22C3|nr:MULTISPECIES: PKD domain-containing protein [Pontibacter]
MKTTCYLLARAIAFSLLCLLSFSVSAQNTSNKGKDFWLGFMGHINGIRGNGSVLPQMSVYITSTVATTGMVEIPGLGFSTPYTVAPNKVTVVNIPYSAFIRSSEITEAKGIHVTAVEPVVVYAHIYSLNISGATLVLPTGTLGREYYAISYEQNPTSDFSEFMVVGVENNTTIEITPTANTLNGKLAGETFTVTLNKGDIYQVQSRQDLTGTKILSVGSNGASCKKIAVFSGSSYTRLGCPEAVAVNPPASGDNLFQQLYPISAWGQNYVTAPMMTRIGGDMFRVLASQDGTIVQVDGGAPVTINKGQFYDFQSEKASHITADKPILLAQYPRTQVCDGIVGDPEMIILNPVEQTLKDITLYSSPFYQITGHYINVLMRTADTGSFRLDGNAVTFTPVPANPEYSYSQNVVTPGNHTLKADEGFNAIAYGFGHVESYGYSAGANIKNLIQNITFDKEPYCDGETVGFTGFASYDPLKWKWYFGDGETSEEQKPTHKYKAPGTYTVSLVTTRYNGNDCDSQDSTSVELIVYPNPEADFSSVGQCEVGVITFEDKSTTSVTGNEIISWLWDFGDGTTSTEQHPQHTYSEAGVYDVKLTIQTASTCTSEIVKQVKVYPLPQAAFDAPETCHTSVTSFKDKSTVAEGAIAAWEWDFGDGSPVATAQNPSHTYAAPGTYTVKLTVTTNAGCQTVTTNNVVINPKPEVKFELPDICIRDEAQFVNQTTISSGSIVKYEWSFGDGTTSTSINPKHKYRAEGTYKVKLTAYSDKGCSESFETEYIVSGAYPVAKFSATDFCQRSEVQFKDESEVAFGRIVKWEWDFGDGATSAEQHPKHNYKKTGTYTVRLTAYSGIVCLSTTTQQVTIVANPDAAFTTSNICLSETATFTNSSSVAEGSIVSYSWNFGDGATATIAEPTHKYSKPGTYTVSLTVTTENGCQNLQQKQIIVYPLPKAAFSPVIACISEQVSFRNESTVSSGSIVAWNWNFGDGNTSSLQHPTYRYAQPGTYKVKLEVTTDNGCKDVLEKQVKITAMPIALAGADQIPVCGTTSTRLQANNPAPAKGTWSILNGVGGTISDIHNPRATFSGQMGEKYKLRWLVEDSPCASVDDEVEILFSPYPLVEAGRGAIIIEGESVVLEGSGEGTLLWSSPQSLDNATIAQPTASPVVTTKYVLQATSAEGCVSTNEVTITVLRKLRIPTGISPNGDGINDVWLIDGTYDYPDVSVTVFNRWGDKVYTSTGYNTPWDGTRDGKPLPDGAYYFIIDTNKGRKAFTGSITILR